MRKDKSMNLLHLSRSITGEYILKTRGGKWKERKNLKRSKIKRKRSLKTQIAQLKTLLRRQEN